jgi:hypothetical protein
MKENFKIFLIIISGILFIAGLAWYEYTIRKLCEGGDVLSCAEIAGGR